MKTQLCSAQTSFNKIRHLETQLRNSYKVWKKLMKINHTVLGAFFVSCAALGGLYFKVATKIAGGAAAKATSEMIGKAGNTTAKAGGTNKGTVFDGISDSIEIGIQVIPINDDKQAGKR